MRLWIRRHPNAWTAGVILRRAKDIGSKYASFPVGISIHRIDGGQWARRVWRFGYWSDSQRKWV
jgi:hypothetical protein